MLLFLGFSLLLYLFFVPTTTGPVCVTCSAPGAVSVAPITASGTGANAASRASMSACVVARSRAAAIEAEARTLFKAALQCGCDVIAVSNEVGLGIVPDNPLARRFRDLAGTVNRFAAEAATEVFFLAAGLPMKMK